MEKRFTQKNCRPRSDREERLDLETLGMRVAEVEEAWARLGFAKQEFNARHLKVHHWSSTTPHGGCCGTARPRLSRYCFATRLGL